VVRDGPASWAAGTRPRVPPPRSGSSMPERLDCRRWDSTTARHVTRLCKRDASGANRLRWREQQELTL
jgi:hypothetical protein